MVPGQGGIQIEQGLSGLPCFILSLFGTPLFQSVVICVATHLSLLRQKNPSVLPCHVYFRNKKLRMAWVFHCAEFRGPPRLRRMSGELGRPSFPNFLIRRSFKGRLEKAVRWNVVRMIRNAGSSESGWNTRRTSFTYHSDANGNRNEQDRRPRRSPLPFRSGVV